MIFTLLSGSFFSSGNIDLGYIWCSTSLSCLSEVILFCFGKGNGSLNFFVIHFFSSSERMGNNSDSVGRSEIIRFIYRFLSSNLLIVGIEQFLYRTIGIMSALSILAAFDVSKQVAGLSDHLNVDERQMAFFAKYIPESDPAKPQELPYIVAMAALQTNFGFVEAKGKLLNGTYKNFREYLQHASEILKKQCL